MRAVAALLAAVLLFSAQPSSAADKQGKIRELIEITGSLKLGEQVMNTLMPQLFEMLRKANRDIPAEAMAAIEAAATDEMRKAMPELLEPMVRLHDRHFTEQEVDALLAFYRSPVGRKVIEKMPLITQQSMAMGHAWGESVGRRLVERVGRTARERGLKL